MVGEDQRKSRKIEFLCKTRLTVTCNILENIPIQGKNNHKSAENFTPLFTTVTVKPLNWCLQLSTRAIKCGEKADYEHIVIYANC